MADDLAVLIDGLDPADRGNVRDVLLQFFKLWDEDGDRALASRWFVYGYLLRMFADREIASRNLYDRVKGIFRGWL